MIERLLQPVRANHSEMEKYGRAVMPASGKPADSFGEGWQCWYPLGTLPMEAHLQIGLVEANLLQPVIKLVECHPTREEWVYAIDAPVIQVVALPESGQAGLADGSTARAILLNPGEGFIIRAGVWHAPAFPVNLTHAYYGFVLPAPSGDVKEVGLVSFKEDDWVRVNL
jgi:hypothetical protein